MRAFEAAARHLSFKKAAEELHVTPAAISLQIKSLEAYLGVPLFHRLTRALEITAEGRAMLPKIRAGFECFAEAIEVLGQSVAQTLNVDAPPSLSVRWLLPRLPKFSARFPDIGLRLRSSGGAVDQPGSVLAEELSDVRLPESGVAIRFGRGNYPGFQVDLLMRPEWVPVCHPALMAGPTSLQTLADFQHQLLIHDETVNDGVHQPGWRDWFALAGVVGVNAERGPRFSNSILAIEAALAGQGVALCLKPLVESEIASGRLVVPFAQSVPSPYAYYLVVRKVVVGRGEVAAFREWILAESQR